ncbi:hypothetical protein [Candidatus Ichthyocystis hellenicum]|uniref:hypothetical protein n=1 Tax=Candidatus Ichthyocystis hellenicum TaxID=1561003 RepID=UPI000B88C8B8|nr:hypothetical protein [Candidatus Ichthyocystis hellenicum]
MFPSLLAEAMPIPRGDIRRASEEKHIREEFDYWASNNHQQENPHHRVKRALDSPVASPADSVSDFVGFVQKNFGLLDQTAMDSYIANIQQSGFSSDAAQEGFKKFLGAMGTVDRVYSLKNNDLANRGYELKCRIIAAIYFDKPEYTKSYETTDPTSFEDALDVLRNLGVNDDNLRLITNDKALTNAFVVLKISNEKLISTLGENHAIARQSLIEGNLLDTHVRSAQELLNDPKLQTRFDDYFASWFDGLRAEEQTIVMNTPEIKAPVKFTQDPLIDGALLNTIMASGICHGLSLCFADSVQRYGVDHAVKFVSNVDSLVTESITDGQLQEITQLKTSLYHLNNLAMTSGEMVQYQSPNFLARADYRTQMSAEEIYRLVLHRRVREGAVFFIGVPEHVVVLVKGFPDAPNLVGRTPLLTFFDSNIGVFPLLTRAQAIPFLQKILDEYGSMDRLTPVSPGDGRAVVARYNPNFSDQVIPTLGNYPVRNVLSDIDGLISAGAIRRRSPLASLAAAVAGNVDPSSFRGRLRGRLMSDRNPNSPSFYPHTPELQARPNLDTTTNARDLLTLRSTASELYIHISNAIRRAGISVEDALIDMNSLFRAASEVDPNNNNNNNINVRVWSAREAATEVTAKIGTETYRAQMEAFFHKNSKKAVAMVRVNVGKLHKLYQMTKIVYPATKFDTIATKFTGLIFDIVNIANLYEMHKYLDLIQNLPEADKTLFIINYAASMTDMVCASAQWSAILTEQLSTLTSSSLEVAARVSESTGNVIASSSVGASAGAIVTGIVNTGFSIKNMVEAKTAYQFNSAAMDLATSLSSIVLGTLGLIFPGFGAIIAGISLVIATLKQAISKYYQQSTVGLYKAMKGFCKTDMEFKSIIELLLANWLGIDSSVISFDPNIPIDTVNISGHTITATKTRNSFQLRPMYNKEYGVNSIFSMKEIAKIRFSFDKMMELKPLAIKLIYPHINLRQAVSRMNKKSLSIEKVNPSLSKILLLPQGKPLTYISAYEEFIAGFGAPRREKVRSLFRYISAVVDSSENPIDHKDLGKSWIDPYHVPGKRRRIPKPRKYLPLVTYNFNSYGGTLAVSYDRGYYNHDSKHTTVVTVGQDSPILMIPPALDFPANQIGITGMMRNSWNRDALTREYTLDLKPNATAAIIANPNADINFREVPDTAKIGITEWYPGQIKDVKIVPGTGRFDIVLEMKPTPIQESDQGNSSPKESPLDKWKKYLPVCKLEDPDPKDHKNADYFDPLAGRAKTSTKFSIPEERVVTLNLQEGIDPDTQKSYSSLACTVRKEGIQVEIIGNPTSSSPSEFMDLWTVGQAEKMKKDIAALLRKSPQTGPNPLSSMITWKDVTLVYDLTCRSDKSTFAGAGWLALPKKSIGENTQESGDPYPKLKNEHVIPLCLSKGVRDKYGSSNDDWMDTELIWIHEPQSNDRVESKNEKWPSFGTYYFFSEGKSLLLKQVDDHPVRLNQVSISRIHPKQVINAITGRLQVVPGETEFSPQGVDGGANGNLFIAIDDVATNSTFLNRTLEFHKTKPLSTVLVPNIPMLDKNATAIIRTLIKTSSDTFVVPIEESNHPRFIGTLTYNSGHIGVIKSNRAIRFKRNLRSTETQTIRLHLVDPIPQTQKNDALEEEQLPQLQELFKEEQILDANVNPLLNILTVRLSPGILIGLQMAANSRGEWQRNMQLLGVGGEIWEDLQKNEDHGAYIKQKLESLFSKYGTPQQRFFPVTTPVTTDAPEGSVAPIIWYDTLNFQMFAVNWNAVRVPSSTGETTVEKIPQVYHITGYSQKERQVLYVTVLAKYTPVDYLASIPINGNKECSNWALKFSSLQDMGDYRFLGKLWQSNEGKTQYKTPPLPGVKHLTLLPQDKVENSDAPAVELVILKESMEYLKSITLASNLGLTEETEMLPKLKFSSAGYTEFMGVPLDPVMIKVDGSDLIMEVLKPKINHSDPQEGPGYFIIRLEQAFNETLSLHHSCGDIVTVGEKTYSLHDLQTMLPQSTRTGFDESQDGNNEMEEL